MEARVGEALSRAIRAKRQDGLADGDADAPGAAEALGAGVGVGFATGTGPDTGGKATGIGSP